MSRRFIVRPLAEADLETATRWYDAEQPGLAQRFLKDVDRSFARLRERPLQFPVVAGDVRRALMHTFQYAVYFRVSNEIIVVLGCAPSTRCGRPARLSLTDEIPESLVVTATENRREPETGLLVAFAEKRRCGGRCGA